MSVPGHRRAMWRPVWDALASRPRDVAALAAWAALEGLPAFASGRLVSLATDRGFLAGHPARGLAWLGALAVAFAVGAWATRGAFRRLAAIVEPFRDSLVQRAVTTTLRRATEQGGGGGAAGVGQITRHVEVAREAFASVLMVVQGFVVTAAGALLGLATLAPRLFRLVVIPLAAGLAVFLVAFGRLAVRQRRSMVADEEVAQAGSDLAEGLRDTVACGGEEAVALRVQRDIDAQAGADRRLAGFTSLQTLAIGTGGQLPLVLILFAAPGLVHRGLTAGAILGALTYVLEGIHPALQRLVRQVGGTGLWLAVALRRLLEQDLAGAVPVSEAPVAAEVGGEDRTGVELRGVSFRYGPWSAPVVEGLDLVIPAGDHLAVVGPSGVGKSTLARLMAGLLVADCGEVRIGGVPLAGLSPEVRAARRVLIPQEAYVFAGTLEENLRYLSPAAGRDELDEVMALFGLQPIARRVGGYGGLLIPGALSAGERQLVTLARSYLSPARVVILDEATCHLDPPAEARAELAFAGRGGTLIVIAHRISSAIRARRVLVMDGTEVLVGSHAELAVASRLYGELVGHWMVRS